MELSQFDKNSGADFSENRKFRYKLWRVWDKSKTKVMFIGLNPSNANETDPDPTITRCINFAKSWGYGGIVMTNLFAFVSTDPKKLITSGEDLKINNFTLLDTSTQCEIVIFCWGAFKQAKQRMNDIIELFPDAY